MGALPWPVTVTGWTPLTRRRAISSYGSARCGLRGWLVADLTRGHAAQRAEWAHAQGEIMNNEEKSPTLYAVEEFHERYTGNQWRHVVATPSLNIAMNQARREWRNYDVRIVEYVQKGAYMNPEDIEEKVSIARLCCPFCGTTDTTIGWSSDHSEKMAHVECASCNAKGPGATRSAAGNTEDDPSWDAAEAMASDLWNHRYNSCVAAGWENEATPRRHGDTPEPIWVALFKAYVRDTRAADESLALITSERNAAIARAEEAERERDDARAEVERLREELSEELRRAVYKTTFGRIREERDEAQADVERLREELATTLRELEELREALRKILDKGIKETISDGVYATLASDDEGKP